MKKNWMYRLTFGMIAVAMLASVLVGQASAGSIILVGEEDPNDDPLVSFLQGLGHTVSQRHDMEDQNQGPPKGNGPDMPALNAADLVIISRTAFSGDYDGNAQLWNEVTSPILMMNAFLLRSNRWQWSNTGGLHVVDQAVEDMVITDASHPYVSGLSDPSQVFDYSGLPPAKLEANGGAADRLVLVSDLILPGTAFAATVDGAAFAFSIPAGTATVSAGSFGGKRGFVGTDTYVSNPSEDYGLRLTANYDTLLTNAINDLIIPEPGSMALGLIGMIGVGFYRHRRAC